MLVRLLYASRAAEAYDADAMNAIAATVPIDYLPRFHFVDGGAVFFV